MPVYNYDDMTFGVSFGDIRHLPMGGMGGMIMPSLIRATGCLCNMEMSMGKLICIHVVEVLVENTPETREPVLCTPSYWCGGCGRKFILEGAVWGRESKSFSEYGFWCSKCAKKHRIIHWD